MYFDPGFGSMVIQVLLGGLAFGGVIFASFRQKILKWFRRGDKKTDEQLLENANQTQDDALIDEEFMKVDDDE